MANFSRSAFGATLVLFMILRVLPWDLRTSGMLLDLGFFLIDLRPILNQFELITFGITGGLVLVRHLAAALYEHC